MKKPHMPAIRELLRARPDGMSALEIKAAIGVIKKAETVRNCLNRMPDAYIDRWVKAKRGQYEAIWCVVVPPPNCPYPTDRPIKSQWRSHDQGIPSKD